MARIKAAAAPADPRTVIEAIFAEALPDDEESRSFAIVYTAYLALSLTDPALDIRPLTGNSDGVIRAVAAQLRAARESGRLTPGCDPDLEATGLIALSAGLGSSVLAGQRSPDEAWTVIRYHLDRLLPS
jgi:hypothetical protein